MKNHLPRPPNGLKPGLPCPTNDYFGQQWIAANLYTLSATAGPADPAGQELVAAPVEAPASPSLLSAVEESAAASAHGNDRHYTNGAKLSYTTEPLGEKSLGDSTFFFHRQTGNTDHRLEWTILGQRAFLLHKITSPSTQGFGCPVTASLTQTKAPIASRLAPLQSQPGGDMASVGTEKLTLGRSKLRNRHSCPLDSCYAARLFQRLHT